jgi:GNAT superfamily N-acetyltransferase
MVSEVATRIVRLPEDEDLLRAIYAATRASELEAVAWSEDESNAFIRMQFDAQTRYYAAVFPQAAHSVILVGGEPAGRMIVDRSDREIRVVDIALLPDFRGGGVGGHVVRSLLEEADASGLPVRCRVEQSNPAHRFWEQMGFVVLSFEGAHLSLEREPAEAT